jgi:hypothetical protein
LPEFEFELPLELDEELLELEFELPLEIDEVPLELEPKVELLEFWVELPLRI